MKSLRILAAAALLAGAGCATTPSGPVDFGGEPRGYESTIRVYFEQHLKDPDSAQYRGITPPRQGTISHWVGLVNVGSKVSYGWLVDATINAKNSFGGYIGYQTYEFLFRGERIVDVTEPSSE